MYVVVRMLYLNSLEAFHTSGNYLIVSQIVDQMCGIDKEACLKAVYAPEARRSGCIHGTKIMI